MACYNYENFPLDMETPTFERFRTVCRAGTRAPDGELVDGVLTLRIDLRPSDS